MGPLPTKPGLDKGTSTPTEGTFYGVFIPPDTQPSPEGKFQRHQVLIYV